MIKKIFYNSSLPRSGSTLIQNILAQNPEIYSSPTSGLFDIIFNARVVYSSGPEFKAQDEDLMKSAFGGFCKMGAQGYYERITEKPIVIDKCRGWNSEINFLEFVYGETPKIITMIRDPRAIYASMEKKFRKNPHLDHGLTNWAEVTGTTTDKRVVYWSNNIPIAPVMDRIYQSLLDGNHEKILFVQFEDLTSNPEGELKKIYEYLEIPYFKHDFDNVEQVTQEDDKVYGVFGDHKIREKVTPVKDDFREVLGQSSCQMIYENYAWFYDAFGYKK